MPGRLPAAGLPQGSGSPDEGDCARPFNARVHATVHLARCEVGEASPVGGYVRTVLMNGRPIPAERFRSLIAAGWGWNTIPGLSFALRTEDDTLTIEGKGLGHGIGLCQEGATILARQKHDYRRILSHYFPNLSVSVGR